MAETQYHVPISVSCPLCGGPSRIDVTHKFSADKDGWRIYLASCLNCGMVQITREPRYIGNVYCGACAARLSWTCDLDTAAPPEKYPFHCSQCARVSNAGVLFSGRRQDRLLRRLHKLDRKYNDLWLRAGTVRGSNVKYHEAATARARHLERKRARILKRLTAAAESRPVKVVTADEIAH